MSATDCNACKSLPGNLQCNHHRRTTPNAWARKSAETMALVREGVDVLEAERLVFGANGGMTFGA